MESFRPKDQPEDKRSSSPLVNEVLQDFKQQMSQRKPATGPAADTFDRLEVKEKAAKLIDEADGNHDRRLTSGDLKTYKPKEDLERQAVVYLERNYKALAKTPADTRFVSMADATSHKFADAGLNEALERLSKREDARERFGKDSITSEQERLAGERKTIDGLKDIVEHFDEIKHTLGPDRKGEDGIRTDSIRLLNSDEVSDPAVKEALDLLRPRSFSNLTKSWVKSEISAAFGEDQKKKWQNVMDNFDKIKSTVESLPSLTDTAIPLPSAESLDKSKISDPKMREALGSLELTWADHDRDGYVKKSELEAQLGKNNNNPERDKSLQYLIDHFDDAQEITSGLSLADLHASRANHPGLEYLSDFQNSMPTDRNRNSYITKQEVSERVRQLEEKLAESEQYGKDLALVGKNYDLIKNTAGDKTLGITAKDLPPITVADYENALGLLVRNPRNGDFKFTDYEKGKIASMLIDGHSTDGVAQLSARLNKQAAGTPYKFQLSMKEFETVHGGMSGRRFTLNLVNTAGKTIDSVQTEIDTLRSR